MTRTLFVSATAIAMAIAGSADAAVFKFDVGGPVTGSGTFDASANGDGSFTITDISGTFDGIVITGLLPPGIFEGNDNQLLPNSNPQLTFNGFSFTTLADNYNIFYSDSMSSYRLDSGGKIISVTFTATAGAVPEPETWGLMILGFGAIGFAMRRRPAISVSYAARPNA